MMASEPKQNIKHLKVDNWSGFFLQRLQLLFAKGDCCDLTLKFNEGQELKVHRLVLNTCTTYFETLQLKNNTIALPDNLKYNALQPIINFMYSGRLEFKSELQPILQSTAKILNMSILTKLLNAQKGDEGGGTVIKTEVKSPTATTPVSKIVSPASTTPFNNMLSGKKLPIWRKRLTPLYKTPEVKMAKEEEDPKPTRFEWPGDDQNSLLMSSPSFSSISYESAPVMLSPITSVPSHNSKPLKRRVLPPSYPIADKVQRTEEGGEILTSQINMSDDDDDDGHFETLHNYDDSCDEDESVSESPINQLKPILKPAGDTPSSTPVKKVRFSLENEDKENAQTKIVKLEETNTNDIIPTQDVSKTESTPNHAKIIAEVLKKFPELVKNNKNIKLKITAPSSSAKTTALALDKGKVATKASYVVLKSALKTEKSLAHLLSGEKNQEVSNAENTTGPWLCKPCGSEEEPMNFESYYLYRKHLQDVHLERIDSRICEYCGYKASKRNLHLYHLYTKHNVAPPKNIKFPKCQSCNYIALSESLLTKHQHTHETTKELTCQTCNTVFKTSSSLQAHIVTCKPNNETRNYRCKICKKCFKTNVSLNAHVKVCQEKKQSSCVTDTGNEGEAVEMIEVPVIETVDVEKGQHTLLQLPTGLILTETSNMTLLPSSESDGLNNVASGIATSIGLTVTLPEDQAVILLDENSEFFLQGNNSVMVSNSQEYIVPDILPDVGHIYSEPSIPYAVNVQRIAYPVVQVQNDKALVHQSSNSQNVQPTKISSEKVEPKPLFITSTQSGTTDSISETPSQNISENRIISIQQVSDENSTFSDPPPSEPIILKALPSSQMPSKEKHVSNNENDSERENSEGTNTTTLTENTQYSHSNPSEVPAKSGDSTKAKTLVRDWDFENDEEMEDIIDDPEVKPSRPTIDLQEIP